MGNGTSGGCFRPFHGRIAATRNGAAVDRTRRSSTLRTPGLSCPTLTGQSLDNGQGSASSNRGPLASPFHLHAGLAGGLLHY